MNPALISHSSHTICEPPPALVHSAFYKFVNLPDASQVVAVLTDITRGLTGSVLVAPEGVNGMLAGTPEQIDVLVTALETDVRLGGLLRGIVHKRTACKEPPFARLKVRLKREIVPLGLPGVDASAYHGVDLTPAEWREFIARNDVVVIDNRNSFEFKLGAFEGAIDPQVDNFRDFSAWFDAHLPAWRAENKKIAMYCTGGIRCEKTTAWLATREIEAYQLQGGILNYFAQLPDADADFNGECFVFDRRVALNTQLAQTQTTLGDVSKLDSTGQALWIPKKS